MKNKKNKFLRLFQLAFIMVSWITDTFYVSAPCNLSKFKPLIEKLVNVSHRGNDFLFDYIKKVRTSLLIFLSKDTLNKRLEGISLTKDCIPRALGPLIPYIRSESPEVIQLTLTILYCTRALSLGNKPDLSTITDTFTGTRLLPDNSELFWRSLGYTKLGKEFLGPVKFKNYHWTTKSGPNGHALYSSMNDFYNLTSEDKQHLINIGGSKISDIINYLDTNIEFIKVIFPHKSKILRKLSWFSDKEDKVRVIAVCDYFTQTTIKPLHTFLNRVLTKIPQDCTFDQSSYKDKIKDWDYFASIDLTAFTDRFPISYVQSLIETRFGKEYAESWSYLMVSKPFKYNQGSSSQDIYYKVGTPMGVYSSWPSTTLAHHLCLYECCTSLGIEWKEAKYVMLGDDILIGDRLLADTYLAYISSLGVTTSPLKTHFSETLCEFSKRLIFKGKEITPFPISSIENSSKRYYRLVNLLLDCEDRGWVTQKGIPQAISSFYKIYHERYLGRTSRKKFRKYIYDLSYTSELINRMIRTQLTADEVFSLIWYKFRSDTIPVKKDFMSVYDCHGVFTSLAVESFEESNRKYLDDKHPPLGQVAENLVMYFTSIEQEESVWPIFGNLEYIPLLYAHGYISELYLNIQKEAYRIDTIGQGEWPLFFRTMSIPLDDRVYFERNNSFTSQATATLGKKITERLNLFSGINLESTLVSVPNRYNILERNCLRQLQGSHSALNVPIPKQNGVTPS